MLPVGHNDEVTFAEFSPDGKKIITASNDFTAKIWDAGTGILLADLNMHTDLVSYAQFSPDGKKIVTASKDATAKVWDVATGELVTDIRNLTGVISARFNIDGKRILTTSFDSTANIWDAATGTLLFSYPIKNISSVFSVRESLSTCQFSPDGKKIVTITRDSTAKIWDASNGNFLTDLKNITVKVISAQFSNDGKKLITMAMDSTAKVLDAVSGNILYSLQGIIIDNSSLPFAAFSPDGKKIVTASGHWNQTVKTWDASTGKSLADLKGHRTWVSYAQFSPDGKKVLTASGKNAIIWDPSSGNQIAVFKGHNSRIYSLQFSTDGKKIVTASGDKTAKVWDVKSGNLLADLIGHTNYVNSQFSPACPDDPIGGKKVLTAAGKNAIIWDPSSGNQIAVFKGHNSLIYSLQFSTDGKKIVTASFDSTVKVWNVASGALICVLKDKIYWGEDENRFVGILWRGQTYASAQFSPDGKKIITTTRDSTVKIWDAATGNHLNTLKSKSERIFTAQFSPDGRKIVTSDRHSTVNIWDAESGRLLIDIKGDGGPAQFSPDGKKIVIAGDSTIKIWNAERGDLLENLKGHTAWGISAQFSKDGKRILTASFDSTAKVWDAETGSLLIDLSGNPYNVSIARFSPDEKKIITVSMPRRTYQMGVVRLYYEKSFVNNPSIRIWDAATGKLLNELKGHNTIWITSAYFSPDGKKIITSALDNTTKIWDTESGNLLYSFSTVNEDDYLITDKDNHYDGTEGARKLLYFTCGTEVIELEQVKDQLWVPNLAERIMSGETINAQKLSELNICNLTPVVETIEQTALQYRFQITPRLGGLGASIVYVNGIEVKRYTPKQLTKQQNVYLLTIDKNEIRQYFVSGKENSILVKSLTEKSSISSRSVSINEKANEKSEALPNLYAMVVGVSDYKGEAMDLKYAAKDAMDIGNALEASAKKLLNTDGKEHVFLTRIHTGAGRDKFPEKNAIKQAFAEIAARAQPNDILLVFFAGHGVTETEKKQFYFLTADASTNTVTGALKDVGISTEELTEWIRPQVMKAQKRILIFDACNSGQAIREMISIGKEAQNFIASRGDDNSNQVKAVEKLNERSGMFILSASASDQKAYEMGKYNQGALTYSLLRAIKEEPDILEDRKYLNLSRWFNAAEKSVNELARETGARQQPQIVSTTNFNIGVVDEEVRNKIVLPFEKPMFTRSDFRNTAALIDNLKLRSLVDKELIALSDEAGASLLYSPEYESQQVYQLSGAYTVSGSAINVSVIITRGGTEIKTTFEVKGMTDQLASLAKSISTTVMEWLNKK